MSAGVTLNRATRVYGTIDGGGLHERNLVRSYNFLYFEVNRVGPASNEVFVKAFMDGQSFITDIGEAEAIRDLIVSGGV
jgi:hypothetical protein